MPRRLRIATGGIVYHVLNRGVGRLKLFRKQADYAAFECVVEEVHRRIPVRIISYCLMPTHFHFVLWPKRDDELSEFMRLVTVTHTQRWHAHYHSAGTGPVYQGRFKSFPIEADEHLLTVCRYVERNPLRSDLVEAAESWRWGSLHRRLHEPQTTWLMRQEDWPIDAPKKWVQFVNDAQTQKEVDALAESIRRGRPYGSERWTEKIAKKLDLQSTLRPRGRQRVRPLPLPIKDSRPL